MEEGGDVEQMVDDAVEETIEADPSLPFVSIFPFVSCFFSNFFSFWFWDCRQRIDGGFDSVWVLGLGRTVEPAR